MATYVILNLAFMAVAITALVVLKAWHWSKTSIQVLVILLALTAIFDSLIIKAGIVAYDASLLLGLYIGAAPIEDFFYAIFAAILIPSVWTWLSRERS